MNFGEFTSICKPNNYDASFQDDGRKFTSLIIAGINTGY